MKTKNIIRIVLGTVAILLIPLIAMQFSSEVKWDLADFITIGGLLIGAGLLFELIASKVDKKYRPYIAIAFIVAVLLAWVEGAVGIFD